MHLRTTKKHQDGTMCVSRPLFLHLIFMILHSIVLDLFTRCAASLVFLITPLKSTFSSSLQFYIKRVCVHVHTAKAMREQKDPVLNK